MTWELAMSYAGKEYVRKGGRRQRVFGFRRPDGTYGYGVRNALRGRPCKHAISKENAR